MSRQMITGPNMYALLIREFNRVRPPACTHCRMPLPFWGPAAGKTASVYWYMPTVAPCAHQCHHIIAGLWANLTTEYDIAPPGRARAPQKEKAAPKEKAVAK